MKDDPVNEDKDLAGESLGPVSHDEQITECGKLGAQPGYPPQEGVKTEQ